MTSDEKYGIKNPALLIAEVAEEELNWHQAWRYSNHPKSLWAGEVIVVTQHGWRDIYSEAGDHTPAAPS